MAVKKTTAKAEETKVTTVAAEAEKPVEKKTAPAKKAPAKKTTARKPAEKKSETAVEVFVEYNGVQVALNEVIENVKTNNVKEAKEIKIYLKPEDNTAYYVADGKESRVKVYFC